jgi:hypothetical protein
MYLRPERTLEIAMPATHLSLHYDICTQEEHHWRKSFQEEYLQLLQRSGVE